MTGTSAQLRPVRTLIGGLPDTSAHSGDQPGVTGRIRGIDHHRTGPSGYVSRTTVHPWQNLGWSAPGEAAFFQCPHLVPGQVLGRIPVTRSLYAFQVAHVLVGMSLNRTTFAHRIDACEFPVGLVGLPGSGLCVCEALAPTRVFDFIPALGTVRSADTKTETGEQEQTRGRSRVGKSLIHEHPS